MSHVRFVQLPTDTRPGYYEDPCLFGELAEIPAGVTDLDQAVEESKRKHAADFGPWMLKWRKRLGMSRAQVATKARITTDDLRAIEDEGRDPTPVAEQIFLVLHGKAYPDYGDAADRLQRSEYQWPG